MKPAEYLQQVEDPRLGKLDEIAVQITLKLGIMSRAAPKDRPRYRAEIRALTQDFADKTMALADAYRSR